MYGPFSRSLSVLIYHRVVPEPDALVPELVVAPEFEKQVIAVKRWFNLLSLKEAISRLKTGTLPVRAACVTFDDGYADNATVALPILVKHAVPATFFVATGFLDGGRMFNDTVIETVRLARGPMLRYGPAGEDEVSIASIKDRRTAINKILGRLKYLPQDERQRRVDEMARNAGVQLPSDLMMNSEQVRELRSRGMEIGAHTVTHPILAMLEASRAKAEIEDSKRQLEEMTGCPVSFFAYPNGKPGIDYRSEHACLIEELGFEAAFSTAPGVSIPGSDLFQLPRFTPWDRSPTKFIGRLLWNTVRHTAALR